mgnify:FL=1
MVICQELREATLCRGDPRCAADAVEDLHQVQLARPAAVHCAVEAEECTETEDGARAGAEEGEGAERSACLFARLLPSPVLLPLLLSGDRDLVERDVV